VKYVHVPQPVLAAALTLVATAIIGVMARHASDGTGSSSSGFNLFITSAVEHADGTVALDSGGAA
jgi:hypothetical protein